KLTFQVPRPFSAHTDNMLGTLCTLITALTCVSGVTVLTQKPPVVTVRKGETATMDCNLGTVTDRVHVAPGHPRPEAGGRRSTLLTLLSFHLISGLYVLDTRVKRGAELVNRSPPGGEFDPTLDRPGRPKRVIVRVCWERLAEALCQGGLQLPPTGRASHRFRGRLGTLSPNGPCSLPPLSTWQFEVVDARSLVPVVVATPEPGQASRSPGSLEAKTRVWEEFGEGHGGGLSVGLEEILANCLVPQKGEAVLCSGGELLTATGDIVGRWKKYFEDLLNPTDLPSSEEAEAGDSEVDSSITQAEVTEVVRKLLGGKVPGGLCQGTGEENWLIASTSDSGGMVFSPGPMVVEHRTSSILLRRVLEGLWEFAQPIHMCFVDLEKALRPTLQHVLERFAAECEVAGMRISTSKSEAMVLNRKRVACPLQVCGEVLPQVEEFKYLGVLFTSEGNMEREIDRRIGAGRCPGPSW
ncbi:hypothetical protein L3Q82_014135, partial [Scortum barcoo]